MKHKALVLTSEQVENNRSSAYDYLKINKTKRTLSETSKYIEKASKEIKKNVKNISSICLKYDLKESFMIKLLGIKK